MGTEKIRRRDAGCRAIAQLRSGGLWVVRSWKYGSFKISDPCAVYRIPYSVDCWDHRIQLSTIAHNCITTYKRTMKHQLQIFITWTCAALLFSSLCSSLYIFREKEWNGEQRILITNITFFMISVTDTRQPSSKFYRVLRCSRSAQAVDRWSWKVFTSFTADIPRDRRLQYRTHAMERVDLILSMSIIDS